MRPRASQVARIRLVETEEDVETYRPVLDAIGGRQAELARLEGELSADATEARRRLEEDFAAIMEGSSCPRTPTDGSCGAPCCATPRTGRWTASSTASSTCMTGSQPSSAERPSTRTMASACRCTGQTPLALSGGGNFHRGRFSFLPPPH